MNISGGTNLSLYEVNEAADIVSSASDKDVNMIFGSVINEDLKDEIVVTVIATGFDEKENTQKQSVNRPTKVNAQATSDLAQKEDSYQQDENKFGTQFQDTGDTLDIPTFLRNRNRRRPL